jgi:hypothetical protein
MRKEIGNYWRPVAGGLSSPADGELKRALAGLRGLWTTKEIGIYWLAVAGGLRPPADGELKRALAGMWGGLDGEEDWDLLARCGGRAAAACGW